MKLTRWDNGKTIHESKHCTIKECVEDAIKQGVNLYRIDLRYADMRGADLRHTNLRGADLRYTNLRGADLRGANMAGADLDYSSWPLWCGSYGVKLDKENNERFAYQAMINMGQKALTEFLQNPVEFANRFAEREDLKKIKVGEK